jgi:uncharacterized SAM-binding protein YcdF (DUF218 family)
MRTRKRHYLFLLALLAGILLTLAHPLWLPSIKALLVVADPLQPADAIVPLAGGLERAVYAARLQQQGYAPWFVATDISHLVSAEGLLSTTEISQVALEHGVSRSSIHLTGTPVSSTYEEALAIRELAQTQGWQSLIVVTSPAHTRRSRMIFREVFTDTGISIIIRPVMDEIDESEEWWQMKQKRKLVLNEYLKLGAFLVGIR